MYNDFVASSFDSTANANQETDVRMSLLGHQTLQGFLLKLGFASRWRWTEFWVRVRKDYL